MYLEFRSFVGLPYSFLHFPSIISALFFIEAKSKNKGKMLPKFGSLISGLLCDESIIVRHVVKDRIDGIISFVHHRIYVGFRLISVHSDTFLSFVSIHCI